MMVQIKHNLIPYEWEPGARTERKKGVPGVWNLAGELEDDHT